MKTFKYMVFILFFLLGAAWAQGEPEHGFPFQFAPAVQGGHISKGIYVENDSTGQTGVISGASSVQVALNRVDGTGVGAAIFQFTGSYSAQNSNISEWFGGRQLTRLRCTDSGIGTGSSGTITFDLPGSTALGTAFDQLVTAGLPEMIRFVIEYTGASKDQLRVRPRASGTGPQISGTTSIIVRSGVAAVLEITRTSGTISDYIFQSISQIATPGSSTADALKLQNPAQAIWDASASGTLPGPSVVKGNAYKVFNAPADGSGRFGEVMQNGDWVVWEGETFTSWSAEPHQWFVMSAHDVRRITALEKEFLTDVAVTPVSDRNSIVRGADYADSAGEIRLKIYATAADYDAADLNTTGDVDEYTDASDQTGYLAIRLTGTQVALSAVLPTLYVYSDDGSGGFTLLGNLIRDFHHQGDFGSESDYLSNEAISYTAGHTIRVYLGVEVDRYTVPNLDIFSGNLSDALRSEISGQEPWASVAAVLFSGATVQDIHTGDRVEYATGYSHGIDWRDMSQSTTINDNRYIDGDLSISVNLAAFTVTGFGNILRKIIGVRLQRNDAQNGEGAMIEIGDGQVFMRVNTSNEMQINTTPGEGLTAWSSLGGAAGAVTLSNTANNFLIFEIDAVEDFRTGQPIPGRYEVVGVFYDGTDYTQLNNIDFTASGATTGDNLGFSRSIHQRGQVTEFRAINSPAYLTHAALETLLRQHQDDQWDFGFARLFEGSDRKAVTLPNLVPCPPVTGSGAPTTAPTCLFQEYFDTAGKVFYKAGGTTDSGDWEPLN